MVGFHSFSPLPIYTFWLQRILLFAPISITLFSLRLSFRLYLRLIPKHAHSILAVLQQTSIFFSNIALGIIQIIIAFLDSVDQLFLHVQVCDHLIVVGTAMIAGTLVEIQSIFVALGFGFFNRL